LVVRCVIKNLGLFYNTKLDALTLVEIASRHWDNLITLISPVNTIEYIIHLW